ncbi:ethylbenzene dehydrogenase-related protein [Thiohalomonas denitrificans]|uniref:Cytochrome c n=1 Tax=Thiohalomonas denitrificans TaxID=415747 RepID=A0A1G5Q9P3_9GAMM|nr:ethylbenzene dehydrogenase-related protein [Thiohalomonas denitrificans]SCZ58338.1 Cytochrome c [Thiohalomonas denitrificans]
MNRNPRAVLAAIFMAGAAAMLGGCSPSSDAGADVDADADAGSEPLRDAGGPSEAAVRSPWRDAAEIAWSRLPAIPLQLYPQQSVEPGLEGALSSADLRATTDGERIALRVDWADPAEDRYSEAHTDRFADSLAIQFAVDGGDTLPYVGMGEPERPVIVWFWRAGRGAESLVAHGFGTLAPNEGAAAPNVDAKRTPEGWSVTLSGSLPVDDLLLPVAVATWDGADGGRDGRKHLSSWHLLRSSEQPLDKARQRGLARESHSGGDPRRGKELVQERGCTACHRLPGGPDSHLGPDLTLAGGIHWPGYLRRSITEPDAFIVPGVRYRDVPMPALDLPESEVEDITSYLSSLR